MHLKKSEAQIGEESIGFSADFSPLPLLQINVSKPSSEYGFAVQPTPETVHGLPLASTPHKRPVVSYQAAVSASVGGAAQCRPIPIRPPVPSPPRAFLRLPFSSATCSSLCHLLRRVHLRLRLVFLISFPFLYFLLVSFSSYSTSSDRSFFLDFFSALIFSSVVLFLLSLSLNLFSFSSLRLLISRSSSLLPRYHRLKHPRPVLWSIGSPSDKPKADRASASGFSVQVYSNGDVFEGEVHKGKCSGSGVYYYYMSGRYEGDWVDSKYDGYGIETWARGSQYRGQYRNGLRHGFGVYRFYTGDAYMGEWSNGQSHGYGAQTCEDGSTNVGEFKWGVKHGLGRYRFRNGDTYAGEYFADKMHGFGVYLFGNGHQYEGAWHDGRRQGLGMYTFRSGETQAGHWQHGALDVPSAKTAPPTAPVALSHSKVLNAVQEARRAADRAFNLPRVDERVNKAVAAANKAASAARVAAVKAVQRQGEELPVRLA